MLKKIGHGQNSRMGPEMLYDLAKQKKTEYHMEWNQLTHCCETFQMMTWLSALADARRSSSRWFHASAVIVFLCSDIIECR